VVTIFDFGTDERTAWLVMELLPGPTLAKLVTDRGPLPVEQVIGYGRQCSEALAAAHAAGITHRDVKPANLMLAADGRCVLVDLGIARLAGASTSTQNALTGKGTILGTVAYVAPEIITGQTPGPPADQYALGAVLFSLLTGHAPFTGDTSAAVFGQHLYAAPPRPGSTRNDTPAALDDLVVALLGKDPVARPGATEVAQTLAAMTVTGNPDAAAVPGPAVSPADPRSATTAVDNATALDHTRVLDRSGQGTIATRARGFSRRGVAALASVALAVAVAVVLVAVIIGNSNKTPGTATGAKSVPSGAQPRATSSAPATTAAATTTTSGSSSTDAVAALGAAITSMAGSGAFDPSKAQEAQSWVADFSTELGKANPEDLRKKIGELDQDLTDYLGKQELDSAGYGILTARLQELRGTL